MVVQSMLAKTALSLRYKEGVDTSGGNLAVKHAAQVTDRNVTELDVK